MLYTAKQGKLETLFESGKPGTQELCYHCHEPVSRFSNISTNINGVKQPLCCHGCKAAVEFIHGSGLTEFYQRRAQTQTVESSMQRPASSGFDSDWSFLDKPPVELEYVAMSDEGNRQLSVYIQGVYCASCSWLITKALGKLSQHIVVHMDVNAKRLFLEVSDSEVKLSDILDVIQKLGYQPKPISANTPQGELDKDLKLENRQALKRIAVAGFGMMQVMTYAVALYFGDAQGMEESFRRFLSLISMLVATVVVFYAGKSFFVNAWNDIRNRNLGMDVPIALAIGGAYFPSVYQTLFRASADFSGHIYFDSAVMFVFFLSVGRYIEMRARHRLSSTPLALSRMLPSYIRVMRVINQAPVEIQIMPSQVKQHDRLQLQEGQLLPFDALIKSGEALLDESMISGESQPQARAVGDRLVAGSVVISGSMEVVAASSWAESSIAKIQRLLDAANATNTNQSEVLPGVAQYFVATVMLITAVVAGCWWFFAPERVFEVTLAMLVASCPCAFSLAAPIGATAASYALRAKGLLLANFQALKILPKVTTWCFDKTGTITAGKPRIVAVKTHGSKSPDACLQLMAAIERHNKHVLSSVFKDIESTLTVTEIERFPGMGVSAKVEGERYYLGKPAWVMQQSCQLNSAINAINAELQSSPQGSIIALAGEHGYLASVFVEDHLRPHAQSAIKALRNHVDNMVILSGDRLSSVQTTADQLQIDHLQGDMLPEQKMQYVSRLQGQGEVVAMLGDGVNDAPVIAQADVSIAMSSGSEVSHSQADIIVLNGNLASLNVLYEVASASSRITRQNLVWALLYNLTALPLAAAGLLTPWLAALGMSASSLLVVLNALRINR